MAMEAIESWRGIFPIPVTPFNPDLTIDYESLRRQVRFCLAHGAHGLVYPAVVSEFFTLGEDERRLVLETVLEEVDGRIPVIAGVTAASTPLAARLAGEAAGMGASGVMAMVPYVKHFFSPDLAYVVHHYRAVAAACDPLPLIMQNARIGHPVPLKTLPALLDKVPRIRYLKQETGPSTHQLSAAIEQVGKRLAGVFGGIGGVYLLSELDRGAAGSMPAPPFVDMLVQVYDAYQAKRRERAQELLAHLGPLFTFELLYNVAFIKEILRRRGVIAHISCRVPVPQLDAADTRIIDELMARLGDMLAGEIP